MRGTWVLFHFKAMEHSGTLSAALRDQTVFIRKRRVLAPIAARPNGFDCFAVLGESAPYMGGEAIR